MKLITNNGQLDLPQDFAMHMERTNPLMSDQGDASVPATLPSSPRNLAALGHRERIDRAQKYSNKVPAILQVGPVQKRGQLVVDTLSRRGGIDASLAIDSSDLYATAKNKTLKDIYDEANKVEVFESVQAAATRMQSIYMGDTETYDYEIFPVAVAKYEENGSTVYQYNNEINITSNSHTLVWAARNVREGDVLMAVPAGYGVAPFLKLHSLVRTIFECLGYTVRVNCLGSGDFLKIVVLNNCSDSLVTGTLHYKDMAPSCTLSEFLTWLLAKFHVQPVVNSETKEVDIVMMESMLERSPDKDISDIMEGDPQIRLNPTSRVVLTPTTDIDDTAPAAETFDKLIDKYGGYVEVDEAEFFTLTTASPAYSDCLVMRKSTGVFYSLEYNATTGKNVLVRQGTNYFTYDRNNSDNAEAYSQEDTMPLMLCSIKKPGVTFDVVPYIGERLHFQTSYENKEEKTEQKIMVAQFRYNDELYYYTTGTTQQFIPYANSARTPSGVTLTFGLTNYAMYATFWQRYNELLLNHATRLTMRLRLALGDFLSINMCRSKLCKGQMLIPVSASASLSDKMSLTEAEFLLNKTFSDGIADTAITPMADTGLKWSVSDNRDEVGRLVFADHQAAIEDEYSQNALEATAVFIDSSASFSDTINPGMPMTLGEIRTVVVQASITVNFRVDFEDTQYGHDQPSITASKTYTADVTFTFTAVNA